jgi:tetratricopeptide (TPR) repeat protein
MTKRKHTKGPALNQNGNKVIHVVFGPGGGRITSETLGRISQRDASHRQQSSDPRLTIQEPPGERAGAPSARNPVSPNNTVLSNGISGTLSASLAGFTQSREPVTDVFTQGEIARLLGVSLSRLRTLDRSGIVTPSGRRQGRRAYTFADLIQLRAAQSLLSQQVRLRDVSRAIFALKKTLPRVARPLSELRIVSDGRTIVVRAEDGRFEPLSGQMLLDFDVKQLRDDVVRVLRPNAGRERSRTAYELYLRASQLDEDPETMNEAEELYRKAVELDPWLTIAFTNLGNICFRRQDIVAAEELYRKALELDRSQPEAQYNLGYVMLERGNAAESIPLFQGAISADPTFSDAYFNLAMAYEQNGESEKARPFWADYIRLEPTGTWTEIARRHL